VLDELNVVASDVPVAVVMPELGCGLGAEQFVGQGLDLAGRLWTLLEVEHVAFLDKPVTQVGSTEHENLALAVDKLGALGMHKSGLSERGVLGYEKHQSDAELS
jgi:hypothetical protein